MSTPLRVVPLVQPYLRDMAAGALLYAQANGTKPERTSLLAAICLRETHAGRAPGYRPVGSPDGTGDWTARTGPWLRRMGVRIVAELPPGWSAPRKNGVAVPGPYAIPLDGLGWGRGFFQADVLGDHRDLIAPAPWPLDRQASAACAHMHLARKQLAEAGFADHPLFERAIVSRYNASLTRVRAGLEAGDPDIGTTPGPGERKGDYGRDVLALDAAIVARWPDTGLEFNAPARSIA